MKRILSAVIAATIAVLSLTSCATEQGGAVGAFWNSPAVQAELTLIQNAAFAFINGWIQSHTGGQRMAGGGANTAAADACFANLRAKFPRTPDVVLRGAADKAARSQ